jgi:hypothetical protein
MKYIDLFYVFDASAGTVQFSNWASGTLRKEYIALITNLEDGLIIYSFADPSKGGTITPDAGGDILTLEYDTTSMSDTDALRIDFDDTLYPASNQELTDISDQLTEISGKLPSTLGQKAKAASLAVTLASDQEALPLPTGAATEAKQDDAITQLTSIAGKDFATETTLALIKAKTDNLDIATSALRDALRGAGSKTLTDLETDLAAIKTAVETIDNFISGSKGLVTEDNSAAIKTAVETIDNFISGSRGLVTEDNSAAILATSGATADAIVAAGAAGSLSAKLRRATQGLEDLKTLIVLAAGNNNIGNVDVETVPADPFGANADATVAAGATGSISAKLRRVTQGLEDLKTLIVLGAGNNNIGDVDVASIAAGTNLIGKVAAQHSTSAMSNGTTDVTPKFAKIDRATNADGAAVVNIVSAKKIRVLTLTMVSAGTVSVKWMSTTNNSSGSGVNTDLTGLMSLVANTGMADVFSPVGLFETASGEGLKLNLNAAVQVSGYLTYLEI